MKKIIALLVAVIAIFAMTVPVMADTVDTSVTVLGGDGVGDPPDIAVSWVMTMDSMSVGDDLLAVAGTQVYPPLMWQTQRCLCYFALVDDRQGDSDVTAVELDVWHPAGSPEPYGNGDDIGYLKYERSLDRYTCYNNYYTEEGNSAFWFGLAVAFNLLQDENFGINPNTGNKYTVAEINELINQTSIGFWVVCEVIDYEQPAGIYTVEVRAGDTQLHISSLTYHFVYIPVSMVEYDFSSLNYGKVVPNTPQEIDGDYVFDEAGAGNAGYDPATGLLYPSPAQATVRNIGNVWSLITVYESNLYDAAGNPLPKDAGEWNVTYDACLSDPCWTVGPDYNPKSFFYPEETVTLYRTLYLSEIQKLDFSINFLKDLVTGDYHGTMTLGSIGVAPWLE